MTYGEEKAQEVARAHMKRKVISEQELASHTFSYAELYAISNFEKPNPTHQKTEVKQA